MKNDVGQIFDSIVMYCWLNGLCDWLAIDGTWFEPRHYELNGNCCKVEEANLYQGATHS